MHESCPDAGATSAENGVSDGVLDAQNYDEIAPNSAAFYVPPFGRQIPLGIAAATGGQKIHSGI